MQIGSVLIWLGSGYNPNKYNTASKNVLNFRWTKQTGDPRKWWNTTFGPNTISLGGDTESFKAVSARGADEITIEVILIFIS